MQALEKELPDLKKKLKQAESDLARAEEGENKATEEVEIRPETSQPLNAFAFECVPSHFTFVLVLVAVVMTDDNKLLLSIIVNI